MHKLILSSFTVSAVCTALLCPVIGSIHAEAYEAPSDIHLTIETKEIDINDIPEDRTIPLEIYTENCPPYVMLTFYLEKDSRMEYLSYHFADNVTGLPEMGGIGYELGSGAFPDIIGCNIPARNGKYIDYNGLLVTVSMILPEDVAPGEFYTLNFKRSFYDDIDLETGIILENDFDAVFGNSCFSELNGGGIRIVQSEESVLEGETSAPQEEPQPEEVPQEEIQQPVSEDAPGEETAPVATTAIPETTTTSPATTESTTVSQTTAQTTENTSAVTETSASETSVTETTTEITSVSETTVQTSITETSAIQTANSVPEQTEEKQNNKVKYLIVGLVAILTAGSALAAALLSKKKK
ncbi:MAG: hypothetical protein E7496_08165 [Ruminococcus sp.]|nr:hypothetical protein [Ruminococcus sp.]